MEAIIVPQMHRTWVVFLALSLVASPAAFEEAGLLDADHLGLIHVDDGSEGHHHGDADDKHETPDSPCHHHQDHICSGHGQDLAICTRISIVDPGPAHRFKLITVRPTELPSIHRIFHIPIA
jgi:hypothetical protein